MTAFGAEYKHGTELKRLAGMAARRRICTILAAAPDRTMTLRAIANAMKVPCINIKRHLERLVLTGHAIGGVDGHIGFDDKVTLTAEFQDMGA